MRIIFVIHSLNIGGSETIAVNYLMKLKEYGHDVFLLQMNQTDSFLYHQIKKEGIPVYTVLKKRSNTIGSKILRKLENMLRSRYKLNYILKELHPDIVHFHTNISYIDKLNLNYRHTFFTFHTSIKRSIHYPNKKFKIALKNACGKGMHLVTLSEQMKQELQLELPNVSVSIIQNGIDIHMIQSKRLNRKKFLSKLGIPEDAFILGHVGRFHPIKNHEKIINVFSEVHNRVRNSYLLLVGGGEQKRMERLKQRINDRGVSKHVLFLGEREDAKYIMSVFDCFILPSYTEGFPLVACECQAYGVRMVVSDRLPDEVIVNDNCFKLDINQSDEKWADYILGDFKNKHRKKLEDLDLSAAIERHVELYREGLKNDEKEKEGRNHYFS